MPSAPFQQLPFDQVPEAPVAAHRWAEATRRDITIRTDGLCTCRVAVREYGSGPPLLLVHGMGSTGYSWRYVLEPLGRRYRLVILDMPGAGDSDHPDVYLGPDVQARALLDPIVPALVGDRLRELIPNAQFVKLSTGSHFAHVDATAHFLESIDGFLSGG